MMRATKRAGTAPAPLLGALLGGLLGLLADVLGECVRGVALAPPAADAKLGGGELLRRARRKAEPLAPPLLAVSG
jgi:hypothetical protein